MVMDGVVQLVHKFLGKGKTKEGDMNYIVHASLSPNLDLERDKKVFSEFVE